MALSLRRHSTQRFRRLSMKRMEDDWSGAAARALLPTLAGLLLSAAAAAQPTEPIVGKQFLGATEDADGNVVFSVPIDIDWEHMVPPDIAAIPDGEVSPETFDSLERLAFYSVLIVSFDALLDPRLKRDFYYYVSPFGVVPLKLLKMRGDVILHLDSSPPTVGGGRAYDGAVVAEMTRAPWVPSHQPPTGGFVVARSTEIPRELLEEASSSLATFMESRGALEGLSPETLFRTVVRQYQFRMGPDEATYEFRQWAPDEGCIGMCCSSRYSIGRPGADTDFLATQLYDCDV
jgi:hypothetical protein